MCWWRAVAPRLKLRERPRFDEYQQSLTWFLQLLPDNMPVPFGMGALNGEPT